MHALARRPRAQACLSRMQIVTLPSSPERVCLEAVELENVDGRDATLIIAGYDDGDRGQPACTSRLHAPCSEAKRVTSAPWS